MKIFDWQEIDTVLLDMDGTLLDLHFDNYFWLEYLPQQYALKKDIPVSEAKQQLTKHYQDIEGTMNWYCLDYWDKQLDMDIAFLKHHVSHLIQYHPHTEDFLDQLKSMGKNRILVANAHPKSLALKLEKTNLSDHLEQIISSHELGFAKEENQFWQQLQLQTQFNPEKTLLVEDNIRILHCAKHFGVKHLLAILQPDSQLEKRIVNDFPAIHHFGEII